MGRDKESALADFTEMPALLQVADQALIEYIERLQSRLHGLRARVLDSVRSDTGRRPAASEVDSSEGQPAEALQVGQESAAVLPMLNVAGNTKVLRYTCCFMRVSSNYSHHALLEFWQYVACHVVEGWVLIHERIFTGGLMSTLEVLDASLRAIIMDLGLAIDAQVASEADRLHPARLRLTANQVRPLRNPLAHWNIALQSFSAKKPAIFPSYA